LLGDALPPATVPPSVREQAADWQDEEEREKEDVPVAGDEHDSGEQQSP
jgi:hypothetical protein